MNVNSSPVVYGFAGREYDFESGLSYNGWRMYNFDMGRFTQKDPIGLAGGDNNLYNYVGGSPQMFVDPMGLKPGDLFSSEAEAAGDVLSYINPHSVAENVEYSGTIEIDRITGKYVATNPVGGNQDTSPFNPTSNSTASYHTHAGYSPIHKNEIFSPGDIAGDKYFNINSYVATPKGNIKFRTPTSNQDFNTNSLVNACKLGGN